MSLPSRFCVAQPCAIRLNRRARATSYDIPSRSAFIRARRSSWEAMAADFWLGQPSFSNVLAISGRVMGWYYIIVNFTIARRNNSTPHPTLSPKGRGEPSSATANSFGGSSYTLPPREEWCVQIAKPVSQIAYSTLSQRKRGMNAASCFPLLSGAVDEAVLIK
jgi:hypothetical protein